MDDTTEMVNKYLKKPGFFDEKRAFLIDFGL
jgi:hypothetical protein